MTEPLKKLMVAAIIILGTLLRLFFINRTFQYDEAFTYYSYVETNPFLALANYSYPNNHIFHTLLVQISTFLFGDNLFAIRLPAFIAGVLLLPLGYIFFKRVLNRNIALLGLAIISVAPPLVEYSVNARGYTLICCCFLLLLLFVLKKESNRFDLLWMIIIAVIGFHSIPVFLYPFSIAMIWLWMNRGKRALKNILIIISGTALGSLVMYTPVLIYSGLNSLAGNSFITPEPFLVILENLKSFPLRFSTWISGGYGITFLILTLLGIASVFLKSNKKLRTLLLSALIGILSILLLTQKTPPTRVWIFLAFIWIPILLVPLRFIKMHQVAFIVLSLLFSIVGMANTFQYIQIKHHTPDFNRISLVLQPLIKSGDQIIAKLPLDYPLEYYLNKNEVPFSFEHVHNGGYPSQKSFNNTFILIHTEYNQHPKELFESSKYELIKSFKDVELYKAIP